MSSGVGDGRDRDTEAGGPQAAFPLTPASAILGVRSGDAIARARAFTTIARLYWKPVYKRIRLRHGRSNEAAKDLTQAFFARALEQGTFERYDHDQARFRTFVRACLDHFVLDARQHESALKRGGGVTWLALELDSAEDEIAGAGNVVDPTDERLFDRDWVASLYRLSVEALRSELSSGTALAQLRVFEAYDLVDESERPTYAALATSLGVKPTDVTNHLHAARRKFRRIVLAKLREVTSSDEEFRSEAIELLGIDPDARP